MTPLLVLLGAGVGSGLRYLAGRTLDRPGQHWGTLLVNVVGSFLLGAIAWVVQSTATAKSEAKAMAVTQRMEEMAKTKEAEIKNLQQDIEDLKAQKAPPRKPKPANSPSVQPK